jgi:anti-sigma-K factor RskA
LAGTELTKQAAGILLYDIRTQKAWLYALHLPECPTGMTYQLWAMHEKPVSVGTFHVGSGETSHVLVKPVPNFMNAKKFSVSLEPIGGRPQPSGPLYLLSQS